MLQTREGKDRRSPAGQSRPAEARLLAPVAQCEVARWIRLGPRGLLARWRSERMALVQGFLLFFDFHEPLEVSHAFSLSSIVSVTLVSESQDLQPGSEAGVPCLHIQLVAGGRPEVVRLRLPDTEAARRWLRRLEVARESSKFTQAFLPVTMLSKALEAWRRQSAAEWELAAMEQKHDWEEVAWVCRASAVNCWLQGRLSNRLHGFLHRACRVSDTRGASVVLASLGALHLSRALQRLKRRRQLQVLRALWREPPRGALIQRHYHAWMKTLFHGWFRIVGTSPTPGQTSTQANRRIFQVPLLAIAFDEWCRGTFARQLQRRQAALDSQLDKNLELLEECQALPAHLALKRLVCADREPSPAGA